MLNCPLRSVYQLKPSLKLRFTILFNLCQLYLFFFNFFSIISFKKFVFPKLEFELPFKTKEMPTYIFEINIFKLNLYLHLLLNRFLPILHSLDFILAIGKQFSLCNLCVPHYCALPSHWDTLQSLAYTTKNWTGDD